ncbi:aldo/keto reductase [Chloroflexota bacterium]
METIRLGKTGMIVSKLGFGGIPIQRLTEDDAVAVVKRCLDLGITYLDTANGYSTSEERIGKAVAGRREKVIIATKSGARTREGVEEHLQLSLKRLGTDYIDLIQFHNIADTDSYNKVIAPGGALDFYKEAKAKGVVKHIGVTSHSMDMAKEMVKSGHFETIMFPFNFITSEAADELLPLTREHDVGFIVMKPFAGGMLDNATLAFKYLSKFPDAVPIPGIEKIEEIEEIVRIVEGQLQMTAEEEAEMQRMRDELGTRFCRRCQYCLPCTVDIPITSVMTSPSFHKRMAPERYFSGNMAETIEKAAGCTECGECEERCPYNLPIREMMAETVAWYRAAKIEYDEQMASR